MLVFGAQSKDNLGLRSDFVPFQQMLPGVELNRPGAQWVLCRRLFVGSYVDAYVLSSYHGGLDIYLRSPEDEPITAWWAYSSRGASPDPALWHSMPPATFERVADFPEWTQLLGRL